MEAREGAGEPGLHRDPPLSRVVTTLCLVPGLALTGWGAYTYLFGLGLQEPTRAVSDGAQAFVLILAGAGLVRCCRRR